MTLQKAVLTVINSQAYKRREQERETEAISENRQLATNQAEALKQRCLSLKDSLVGFESAVDINRNGLNVDDVANFESHSIYEGSLWGSARERSR